VRIQGLLGSDSDKVWIQNDAPIEPAGELALAVLVRPHWTGSSCPSANLAREFSRSYGIVTFIAGLPVRSCDW
jgi:hypothetical protein